MPFQIKSVVTRPNTDAPWYVFSEEFKTHFNNTYKDTAWLGRTIEPSADNLQLYITNLWTTSDIFRSFLLDPIVESELLNRHYHYSNFNITVTEEYIDVPA